MTSNKSEQTKDPIWNDHLKWLDLVSDECDANQLKRIREKAREGKVLAVEPGYDCSAPGITLTPSLRKYYTSLLR